MCGDYNLRREKRYVEVDVRFTPDGKIRPPVSYTHLDVYKRQLHFITPDWISLVRMSSYSEII